MAKFISCFRCNDNGKTSNACHCDEEPQVFSRCEPAYEKLQSDLRKLVERWREMSNGKDYYDSGTFADGIEELLKRGA